MERISVALCTFGLIAILTSPFGLAFGSDSAFAKPPVETASSIVDVLHAAFGEHHARAVHTKGVMFEGIFLPAKEASTHIKEPIFGGGVLRIIGRFSVFAGVPGLPDNDDNAWPAGLGIKIKAPDGEDCDIEVNQHKDVITATSDEFAVFLRALRSVVRMLPIPTQ